MSTADTDPTVGTLDPTVADAAPSLGLRDETLVHGTTVARYMVLRMIGRGGVGTVYAAHDPNLDRQIALKLLHSARGDAPERLVREAQALARLTDPHVVAVYDAGEIEGRVFIAMQLVDGEDLATALLTRRRPGWRTILGWFVQAGRGLAAAHAAGMVHRDFKPSNALIDRKGHVAVTDFGLVRSAVAETRGLTGIGDILGTPAFMSPEQHDLQPATQASDQFAFCVSVWDGLFAAHPFVEGDRGSMSPFEIGYRIFDGALIPPPSGTPVPRRVIDALTRGLSRDPAKRWPTMDALLAELEPGPQRRIAPAVAAGVAAAVIGGVAVWLVLATRPDDATVCRTDAEQRIASAWSPATAKQVHDQFGKTGRTYAEPAATQATTGIDHYGARWAQLAGDVCIAERSANDASSAVVARRRTCLDRRLDALRGVARLLATEASPDFVDHAQAMVDGLPDLGDCTDPDALPGVPPPDKATAVAELDADIALASARGNGGDPKAQAELAALLVRADQLAWPPVQIRANLALGLRKVSGFQPGGDELTRAAELATEHRLDREAARAWAGALQSAGVARKPDIVAMLAPIARAAAVRTGDRDLQLDADIAYGRALARLGKYQEASVACKATYATALTLQRVTAIDTARDCLVESLVPLGAFAEAQPVLDQQITEGTKLLGADHPKLADYLSVRASMALRTGKIAEARADADRVLAIRRRAFPPRHIKMAEAYNNGAQVAMGEGNVAEAKKLYEQALAIAVEAKPEPLLLLGAIHTMLAVIALQAEHDQKGAIAHFEQAIPIIRQRAGDDSLELGVLLSNYGQVKAADDVDAGLGILGEARSILDKLKDKRAILVATAMAEIEADHKRWPSAKIHAEEMIAKADADADPVNLALAKWVLARALTETGGDRKRARALAVEARAVYAQLGPAQAAELAKLDTWLKKH